MLIQMWHKSDSVRMLEVAGDRECAGLAMDLMKFASPVVIHCVRLPWDAMVSECPNDYTEFIMIILGDNVTESALEDPNGVFGRENTNGLEMRPHVSSNRHRDPSSTHLRCHFS
jgi:hypothetical protein